MKYIDAEKLIAEIDRKWKELADKNMKIGGGKYDIEISTYLSIKNLITSLQQEQPFPRWIHANYSDKPEIRYTPSGTPYLQNGTYMIWLSDLDTLPKDGTDLTNPIQEQPEVELEKFTEKIKIFQARYKHPESISIKGAMAFMARMFYQYPNIARQWYEQLPKATMD